MPFQREHFHFALLLLCVPLQYYAVNYFGSNEVSRTYAISQMVKQFKTFQSTWMKADTWKRWCRDILLRMADVNPRSIPNADDDDQGESTAFEVLRYRDKDGYFAQSPEIRNPKSELIVNNTEYNPLKSLTVALF